MVVVSWEFEGSGVGGDGKEILWFEAFKNILRKDCWMSEEKFADWLGDDISDGLVSAVWLRRIKWHEYIKILLQTLWFADNNLSNCAQEHVFWLGVRLLDHVEDLVQEELDVSDGDHT